MIITLTVIALLIVISLNYLQQAKFGKAPFGKHLAAIKKSPNYKDGKFHNVNYTPNLTEGYSIPGVMYEFFFKRNPKRTPLSPIPTTKTDLLNLPIDKDILVWFGHSSYFFQLDGKRFLVDPVFSGNASPIAGSNKAFLGTDQYAVSDLPEIDYLLITHDHYDHIDYDTIIELKPKVKRIICGLGVGTHFESWRFSPAIITEKDWNETVQLEEGFILHTAPARHFSGRKFKRNISLWLSFIVEAPTMKIYIGGDSGYDTHFTQIGNKYGPIDLALLDNGQYDPKWKYIHMLPEEVLQAGKDLKAKRIFPIHSSKFAMANHSWDEPLNRITEANKMANLSIITPMIGEQVDLKNEDQQFSKWWIGLK